MKRITMLCLSGMLLAVWALPWAAAQDSTPLGDIARQVRKQKAQAAASPKKFDNDNLPTSEKLSVVGQAPPEATEQSNASSGEPGPPSTEAPAAGQASGAAPAEGQAPTNTDSKDAQNDEQAQKQKMYQEWQQKIHSQQDKVDLLSRELDVANREYRLRAAAFYADAGNRLRNSTAWDKEDVQYKEQLAAKQKAIDDAKKQLEDLQEDARKAGVPSSMRE